MLRPSVIIPSRGRSEMLCDTVRQLLQVTPGAEVIVVGDSDDCATVCSALELPVTVLETEPLGYVMPLWNLGLKHCHNEWVMPASDDLIFGENWFEKAIAHDIGGYVGLNDLHTQSVGSFAPCWMVTKAFIIQHLGGVVGIPHYRSWCNEVEVARHAQKAGVYVWAEDAIVEHRHYVWGNMAHDATHKQGEKWHHDDYAAFDRRKKAGFPIDYPPAITDSSQPALPGRSSSAQW